MVAAQIAFLRITEQVSKSLLTLEKRFHNWNETKTLHTQ